MAPAELTILTGQPSPRLKRSQSISSDRPSLQGYGGLLSPPITVSPDAAFIAASAASQIVTNDHDSQADTWFDQHGIEPSGETALVAPPALKLVNRFLDQLLFNFLSVSRSTSLAALRPAVCEVLKPKLAREAISGADQELNEYLGTGEDEDLLASQNGLENSKDWDLELVWKRTRLRCMVYSSLGDMEEEEEDYYTEHEHLDLPTQSSNQYSTNPGVVSPAVAIFLTSILEYMGEQVLVVAGQAAYHRLRSKHEKEEKDGSGTLSDIAERVIVEEHDMERVGLDRTLGRLWRGWKKRVRSPTTSISMSRSFSRESLFSQPQSGTASIAPDARIIEERRPSLAAILAEHEHAANIPLPMTDNDIQEIEVPGLANQSDDEDEKDEESHDEGYQIPTRPKSWMNFNRQATGRLTSISPQTHTPIFKPSLPRNRSNSLPSPAPTPYTSPKRVKDLGEAIESSAASSDEAGIVQPVEVIERLKEKSEEPVLNSKGEMKPKRLATEILSGAATLGAATVAGIVAAANGEAPQTTPVPREEPETVEEFNEEPQIMTSSRVSIGGRVSPDEPKETSRRSSVRSTSIHSLRLIDVSSPKTPQRSRQDSMDAAELLAAGRPTAHSRPSSIHSNVLADSQTPRVSNPVSRGAVANPATRNGSSLSISRTRNSAEESIAEVEERAIENLELQSNPSKEDSASTTAVLADLAATMQGAEVTSRVPEDGFVDRELTSQPLHKHHPQSGFVLAAAPVTRAARRGSTLIENGLPILSDTNASPRSLSSKGLGIENGAPPLTPLRETMDRAGDMSHGSSFIAPSTDTQSLTENTVSQSQRQVFLDQQRLTRPTTLQRGSPPRPVRKDSLGTDSANGPTNSQRSLHTSGSGSSSNSQRRKAVRTSEENGTVTGPENKSKSFEQLIRSDQTIQYTLTPQNMRDIEDPDSPRNAGPMMVPNGLEVRPSSGRAQSPSTTRTAGLHSNSLPAVATSVTPSKASSPVPQPALSVSGARVRTNAPQPRDARVDRDSLGDFAEFIRSTASYEPAPITSTLLKQSVSTHRGANGSARNFSGSVPRVGTPTSLPKRSDSSAGRNRLQARDAAVPRGDSISDLIDFVRSGPQLDRDHHRIPRTVAPFRSTMDSDQMSGAVGGKAVDATLPDPRYSQASNSVNGSVTSQAPLLKNKALPPQSHNNEFEEEDMMPKRKTRRVRDPYAIDFSDDEDDFEATTSSKSKPIQEESLADFLRNVPPPPELVAPVFQDAERPSSKGLKKKASSPSFVSRFGRSNSSTTLQKQTKFGAQEQRPSVSKPYPSHKPIAPQHNTVSSYSQPQSQNAGNTALRPETARSKVAQKSYQPREAIYTPSAGTNDLADFLLRSEPPSNTQTRPQTFLPTVNKEEASAFQRMFGRKKVH